MKRSMSGRGGRLLGPVARLLLVGCAAGAAGVLGAAGCRSAVADFYDPLTSAPTGSGGSGGTGGTGGLPDECQGDPTQDPSLARDGCGVFVDASVATSGDGTKAAPFKSVAEAAATSKARIFVCAGEYTEEQTVTLSNGVSVYGGFSACPKSGDWTWDAAAQASLTGPPNLPAVLVTMGQSHIEAMSIVAPDATEPGGSSIALVAEGTDLSLAAVEITAGAGLSGEDGLVPDMAAKDGDPGEPSTASAACFGNIVGGVPGATMCPDGETGGGPGGKGGTVPANNGEVGGDGGPLPAENPDGEGLGGTVNASGVCNDGKKGKLGDAGELGAGGTETGTLTAGGVVGGDGQDGASGKRGQGGGGGAGAKAGSFCPPGNVAGAGASGGGGGAGGCGGKGGGGGKAGGSSIGVVSLGSALSFSGVKITAGAGGDGGNGALGKAGGNGGMGADGGAGSGLGTSLPGCRGGNGGNGGAGGTGGGGRGGHSIGVAYTGEAPGAEGVTVEVGSPGAGGKGDELAEGAGDGAPGTAGEAVVFD